MVVRFFRDLCKSSINRDSFAIVAELEQAIAHDVERHDADPKPFNWGWLEKADGMHAKPAQRLAPSGTR